MSPEAENTLMERVAFEAEQLGQCILVDMKLDLASALYVSSALQLALRQPEFGSENAARILREMVQSIRASVPENCPAIRELIALGIGGSPA